MLRQVSRPLARATGTRRFFDYVAVSQGTASAAGEEQTKAFSWDFANYLRKHFPDQVSEVDTIEKQFKRFEGQSRSVLRPAITPEFAKSRAEIADPNFVDDMEVNWGAQARFYDSNPTLEDMAGWSKPVHDEAQATARANGEAFEKYDPKSFKEARAVEVVEAEKQDVFWAAAYNELKLDYEQVEAERDMFGLRAKMMTMAEHPQYAEIFEELSAGNQSFHDYVLWQFEYQRFIKKERLAQLQDERRREIFLQNNKWNVSIIGVEP